MSCKTLSEWERGYLAGIIDGEGCIRISRGKSKRYPGRYYYCPRLIITNTNLGIMKKVQEIIGYSSIRGHHTPKGTPSWKVSVGGHILSWLLPQLDLIGKREHKLLVLEAIEANKNGRDSTRLEQLKKSISDLKIMRDKKET